MPVPLLHTARLVLPGWSPAVAAAVVAGTRRADWAADFPADGDRVVARLLARDPSGPGWGPLGHRLLVERDGGAVVGGAGLFPAPDDGPAALELGYGVVASRRGRGYAAEAARALLDLALAAGAAPLVAGVDPGNPASVRVLERLGMRRCGTRGGAERFRLDVGSPV
ncbi:GNAT family protein [Pseudonocardia spirodelae]|uniref:GNAT family protein n=1 Tax=Pseudonocardia spirodelae TaxID=3133431 RepID=A0ABU8TBG7_9PSEU